jgi:hypothetical protein
MPCQEFGVGPSGRCAILNASACRGERAPADLGKIVTAT